MERVAKVGVVGATVVGVGIKGAAVGVAVPGAAVGWWMLLEREYAAGWE